MRPEPIVLVTGTRTGVGKTWVAAALAAAWRADGSTVAARKPVQSFTLGETTDADILAEASGEEPHDVCPSHRWYPLAMAPPMAAEALSCPPFTVADLVAELVWPTEPTEPTGPPARYGVVEGVGGPRSPLAADGDTVSLASALQPDHVVLVADAGLGAINAVLLSAAAFAPRRPVVFMNRYDAANYVHAANARWLRERAGLQVHATIPELLAWVTGPAWPGRTTSAGRPPGRGPWW